MVAALVVLVGSLAIAPAVASACTITRSSNGPTSIYLGFWYRQALSGLYYNNVYSKIVVKEPYLPPATTDSNATSYAWVMLLADATNPSSAYAQLGPIREYSPFGCSPSSCTEKRFNYGQCQKDNGTVNTLWQHWWSASSPDSTVGYNVFADQTGTIGPAGYKYFVINGVQQTQACPYTFGPDWSEIAAEIHDQATQVPGSISNPENYTAASVSRSDGYSPNYFDSSETFDSNSPGAFPTWFEHGQDDGNNTAHVNDGACS